MAETHGISLPMNNICFADLDFSCATKTNNEVEEQHRATVNIYIYSPFEASAIRIFQGFKS